MTARVAVVGASGIGQHHARWWALEGAAVSAFVGTSPESVARTQEKLAEQFGFNGTGYTDTATMLQEEQPDLVDVCSPPACHAAHVHQALEAGCDVLCEKPFVFDRALPHAALLAAARRLLDQADRLGRRLSVCTQYSVGARMFQRLFTEHCPGVAITRYRGRLEAPAKGRGPDPVRVWVDLSPHVIGALIALLPGASVQWDTLETRFDGYEAIAALQVQTADGNPVACELRTCDRTEPPSHVRQFSLNETLFEVQGGNDAEGVFCARIATPASVIEEPDMMRLLIREMLHGGPVPGAADILANLELMLGVLARAS